MSAPATASGSPRPGLRAIHVFQLAAPMIPEATRSLRQIGRYIRQATG